MLRGIDCRGGDIGGGQVDADERADVVKAVEVLEALVRVLETRTAQHPFDPHGVLKYLRELIDSLQHEAGATGGIDMQVMREWLIELDGVLDSPKSRKPNFF